MLDVHAEPGRGVVPSNDAGDPGNDELFEMANLYPRSTGLPRTIWVSPRGNARHDARIKVSAHPTRMDISDAAVVAIRPEPHLIEGTLPTTILDPICRWIQLNEAALIDLWNEEIDSVEFAAAIKKLDNARA